jgi:hypothetical protein
MEHIFVINGDIDANIIFYKLSQTFLKENTESKHTPYVCKKNYNFHGN